MRQTKAFSWMPFKTASPALQVTTLLIQTVRVIVTTNSQVIGRNKLTMNLITDQWKTRTPHITFLVKLVHIPSDPMQLGPIYFLTLRKCSVFRVHREAITCQINFFMDESYEVGKEANSVCQLHYFHGLGETDVYLHSDKCTRQNKNYAVIDYLVWRVMTGWHTDIGYSSLVIEHTKFSVDWWFSLFKHLFKRMKVDCMVDIADVVETSAVCNVS